MKKTFAEKLKLIALMPLVLIVRAVYGIKRMTLKKFVHGVSALGEGIIKFIYRVGLNVENFVVALVYFLVRGILLRFVRFVYHTGEHVIDYSVVIARTVKNVVMIIPKSLVRDFSYWATGAAVLTVIGVVFSTNFYALALKVTVNGEDIGYVADEAEFSEVVKEVENSLGDTIGENYVMASNPEYSFAVVNKKILAQDDIYDDVYSVVCEEIGEHYGLYVDGQLVAATEKEGDITAVLDELKKPYETDEDNASVEFVADVEVKKGIYAPSSFMSADDIRAKFSSSTNPMYYTIQEDDYLSDISKATGLTKAQLHALNPELDERRLIPGKKINISQPEVYLGIQIVKTITYSEEIDYETVKIEDNSLYKTQTKVKKSGKKGEKEIVAEVVYVDGVQVDKNIISETVISEPVTREIYVGTKALPTSTSPLAGSGNFIRPINGGYVSCGFGGYRGHVGTDLTMSGAYGKPVYASAAGTVTYVGWSGGYGKLVKISHANGYSTWYAHMSAYTVSVGDKVYQGQQIGRIGSTGNSTGPHLHFEIRINGTPVNAMRYIG